MKPKNWFDDFISELGKQWQLEQDLAIKRELMIKSWFVRYFQEKDHPEWNEYVVR